MTEQLPPERQRPSFLEALAALVGQDTANRLAVKFQPLDDLFSEPLNGQEALSLYVYTTPMEWYLAINAGLRSGHPSEPIAVFSEVLDQALQKLRPFRGVVYRGITVADLEPFRVGYPVGGRITMSGFTSAARQPQLAYNGNVMFSIRSKSAAIIWMWSASFDLDEVVFRPGTVLEILSLEEKGGKVFIALEEIADA